MVNLKQSQRVLNKWKDEQSGMTSSTMAFHLKGSIYIHLQLVPLSKAMRNTITSYPNL